MVRIALQSSTRGKLKATNQLKYHPRRGDPFSIEDEQGQIVYTGTVGKADNNSIVVWNGPYYGGQWGLSESGVVSYKVWLDGESNGHSILCNTVNKIVVKTEEEGRRGPHQIMVRDTAFVIMILSAQ